MPVSEDCFGARIIGGILNNNDYNRDLPTFHDKVANTPAISLLSYLTYFPFPLSIS